MLAALLGGFALRLALPVSFPLHEDEALYGYWALHALHEDPNFLTVWPDKPPLYLWTLAGALGLFGAEPAAARLLNIGLSTLTIAVVAAIAITLWDRRAGAPAALAMALNPFAIAFSPTLFTDPMLVLAGMTGLLMALRGRPFWAGLWLGVAVMTKQQGVLYVPLVAGALWIVLPTTKRRSAKAWLGFGAGLLVILAPVILWDAGRWAVAPSPWDLGARHYGRLTILPPGAWPARLRAWLPWLGELAGGWFVWLVPAVGFDLTLLRPASGMDGRKVMLVRLLGLWNIAFLVLHVVSSVPTWDRYLLPLAPMLALCLAGLACRALDYFRLGAAPSSHRRAGADFRLPIMIIGGLFCLLLFLPAWQASRGERPMGGASDAYVGLDAGIAWLQGEMTTQDRPVTLYHRTLGQHFRYYFYAELADNDQALQLDLRWFPSYVYLADNAAKTPGRALFYLRPIWETEPDLALRLAERNVSLIPRFRSGNMVVYELQPPKSGYCDWCFSTEYRASPSDRLPQEMPFHLLDQP